MGFFKKIFKRKKGGTFFGNLLRSTASAATGGILGSGVGLAKWEAKQDTAYQQAQLDAITAANEKKLAAINAQQKAIDDATKRVLQSKEGQQVANTGGKMWFQAHFNKIILLRNINHCLTQIGNR